MSRFAWFCLVVLLVCLVRESRGATSSVTASAHDAESGEGVFKQFFIAADAQYSNPNGGSASARGSVGQEPETYTTPLGNVFETGRTLLSMKAFATATGGSGDGQFVTNRASASAVWDDELTFRGEDAADQLGVYLRFMFRMGGSSSGDTLSSFDFSVLNTLTGEPAVQQNELGTFDQDFQDVPMFVYADDLEIMDPLEVHLSFSLSVNATGHGSGFGLPHTSTADYSHTVSLISITPYDAEGNVIPGMTIESGSGFVYNSLIVPEPGSAMLAAGWACVAAMGMRVGRKRGRS